MYYLSKVTDSNKEDVKKQYNDFGKLLNSKMLYYGVTKDGCLCITNGLECNTGTTILTSIKVKRDGSIVNDWATDDEIIINQSTMNKLIDKYKDHISFNKWCENQGYTEEDLSEMNSDERNYIYEEHSFDAFDGKINAPFIIRKIENALIKRD